jgi:hypothetical protein
LKPGGAQRLGTDRAHVLLMVTEGRSGVNLKKESSFILFAPLPGDPLTFMPEYPPARSVRQQLWGWETLRRKEQRKDAKAQGRKEK